MQSSINDSEQIDDSERSAEMLWFDFKHIRLQATASGSRLSVRTRQQPLHHIATELNRYVLDDI